MSAISLERVTVTLGGREVVREVTAEIETGHWVALIGPNGAGKTSLLRAVAGLLPCDGSVSLEGAPLAELGRRERAQRLALVPQEPRTPPWLTVAEYVLMGRTPYLRPLAREGDADHDAAARALSRLDLDELAERTLGTLSGGERQALTLLMATWLRPEILLLDEHTAALDPKSGDKVIRVSEDIIARDKLTVLMVTHSMSQAATLGDRLIMMHRGRIIYDVRGAEKRRLRPADLLVRFEELRRGEQLDETAADMLRRVYV